MENASKALIIAGAILLAILIIGLGMVVYNQVSEKVNSPQLDKEVLETYNSPFQALEGIRRGSDVRALINLVRSSNNATDAAEKSIITLTYTPKSGSSETAYNAVTSASDVSNLKAQIVTTNTYLVEMTSYNTKGFLDAITIKAQ